MPITARDVAAASGVSLYTVSRALANSPVVSPETRQRVQAAAADLGYTPPATRGGAAGSTQTIGLIAPDLANPFHAAIAL